MAAHLPYDPGPLPTRPAPPRGSVIAISVSGYPPVKDRSSSIRNPRHKEYGRFVALREAGVAAMKGRAWTHLPIDFDFALFAPEFEPKRALPDYVSGILDTLDGSHGPNFTYLPIVYNDDCQVASLHSSLTKCSEVRYELNLRICESPEERSRK